MKKTIFIISGILIVVVFGILALRTNVIKLPITRYMQGSYAADYSNNKILVEEVPHIFIGKVMRKVGDETLGIRSISTQFSVEVISNIKGELSGNVVVAQMGGYKNGILYAFRDDSAREASDDGESYLLEPGSTYLFATGVYPEKNWYILFPHPSARKLLSEDSGLSGGELRTLSENDNRVKELKDAFLLTQEATE
jgi:hypothetical protein